MRLSDLDSAVSSGGLDQILAPPNQPQSSSFFRSVTVSKVVKPDGVSSNYLLVQLLDIVIKEEALNFLHFAVRVLKKGELSETARAKKRHPSPSQEVLVAWRVQATRLDQSNQVSDQLKSKFTSSILIFGQT